MRLVKFMNESQFWALKHMDMIVLTTEQINVLNAYSGMTERQKNFIFGQMSRMSYNNECELIYADFGKDEVEAHFKAENEVLPLRRVK